MKKLTLIISLGLLSNFSFANTAPIMRGEITQLVQNTTAANLLNTSVTGMPNVTATISDIKTLKTVNIAANQSGSTQLDVTLIDDFIEDISPNARHYPTNFPNRTAEHHTAENLKYLSDWLEPYASAKDASFDLLLRAAKINIMARNLNIGTDYSIRANTHMSKAIKLQPNHPEANFLYGMMLAETGGFKEGQKYLDKAASLGFTEAEQSLAQSDLLNENKTSAIKRLQSLQARYPENAQIAEQVRIIENGGFYIWNIKDDNIFVKPIH